MELRWLKAFVAVAEGLHFARAAEELQTVTSNVSAQVKALEEHLGVRLLERGRRSTPRLTAAGEVFLPEARRVLLALSQAEDVGRAAGRGLLGRVRVGYVATAAYSGVLAETVAPITRASSVEVAIEEMATPEQVEALLAGRIDVGIMRERPDLPSALVSSVRRRETVLLALPKHHPAAGTGHVRAADLSGERFAVPTFGETHDAREEIDAVAAAGQLAPPELAAVRDYLAALALVGAGSAVALVPECVAALAMPGVAFTHLDDVSLWSALLLVHRRDEPAPAVLSVVAAASSGEGLSVNRSAGRA